MRNIRIFLAVILLACVVGVCSADTLTADFETEEVYGHISPGKFDLCTKRDGRVVYFTQSEWNSVPSSEKSQYTKQGVYVSDNGLFFIVALHDSGSEMTWDEAKSRYGNNLPTKAQGEVMAKNYKAINAAITAFGGDSDPGCLYWTRTTAPDDSSRAWVFGMNNGIVFFTGNMRSYSVRAVAPVPFS